MSHAYGQLYQLNSDELERQNYFFSYSSLVVAKRGEFLNLPFLLLSTGIIYFTRASPFSIFQLFNTKTKQLRAKANRETSKRNNQIKDKTFYFRFTWLITNYKYNAKGFSVLSVSLLLLSKISFLHH